MNYLHCLLFVIYFVCVDISVGVCCMSTCVYKMLCFLTCVSLPTPTSQSMNNNNFLNTSVLPRCSSPPQPAIGSTANKATDQVHAPTDKKTKEGECS